MFHIQKISNDTRLKSNYKKYNIINIKEEKLYITPKVKFLFLSNE